MQKNILVTGATGNLGKATVDKLISSGEKVIVIIPPDESLDYAKDKVDIFRADLSDEESTGKVVNTILSTYKTIDAALLLVGGYAYGGIADTDGKLLKKMVTLNFETAYFATRPLFQHMLTQKNGGRIVFIGARPALVAQDGKNSLAYALSKSLLFKLSEMLNAEGASKNVVTSVVALSTLDTDPNRKSMPDADFSKWVKPEEVAEVLAFISSDKGAPLRETVVKVYGKA